jgi:hypothetical protein
MKTSDAINKKVHELPEPLQREVLDFVEYLANKYVKEDSDWSSGVPGKHLLSFAGSIPADDLKAMEQAIEDSCEKAER